MGVGAAEAEGAHPGQGRPSAFGPGSQRLLHTQRQLVEGDEGVGLLEVQAGGDLTMAEGQGHLDQAGHAGAGLQMADVRLHRAQGAEGAGRAVGGHHGAQRLGLDGIPQESARAVGLHVLHPARRDASAAVGFPQHGFLRLGAGSHQPVAAPVVVDGAAQDHGVDGVASGQGLREGLEDDHAGALAAHVAVGAGVEGLAAAIGGHDPGFGEADGDVRREHDVHAAGQGQVALAGAQALTGQVHGHQRGGAGGIHGQAGPL